VLVIALALALFLIPTLWIYHSLSQTVDARLRSGPAGNSISIYAAPHTVAVGEEIEPAQVITELRQAGYKELPSTPAGWYRVDNAGVEIHPGPQSFFRAEPASVVFKGGRISRIELLGRQAIPRYSLEPQLLFDLAGEQRQKRRFVRFDQIPKVLVDAILAAEDKHFFYHPGLDPIRVVKAAYVNVRSGRREQGGSTLTMQLARSLWLDSRKNWKRKITESLITLVLEIKLSKKEIFEYYSNHIYLGEHETFGIHGFGEAARVYFNKDIAQITLPEAALLAGIIQRPSFFDPVRHPERGMARRNLVLSMMRLNGSITADQEKAAAAAPIAISAQTAEHGDAPYFLPLAMEEFRSRLEDSQTGEGSYRVYTTLEPDLQRAAVEAVRMGTRGIDALLAKKRSGTPHAVPQVALIALDAHTGEVRAVVGGRDYAASQLNHVLASRQPGSVFKPFVYAAALDYHTEEGHPFTAASIVDDAPTTFHFGNDIYEPNNFGDQFYGPVTYRRALAKSMNVATVKVAEQVGYGRVVNLARRAGLNDGLRPTPSLALGSYDATPLEIAGAYTVFANEGTYVKPEFLTEVRSGGGQLIYRAEPVQRLVLEPKVAFLMRSLLEEVVQSGTAAGVRARGLTGPAAGKTGTSRDGWFAGFTSNLICVVWVGFDDNAELDLEGAKSALPIWTEFMKRAVRDPYYGGAFEPAPEGIVTAGIDPASGQLAGPLCPESRVEYFIAGSEPRGSCPLHGAPASDAVKISAEGLPLPRVSHKEAW
jgi:penicillin-binding protein 1B